MADDAIASTSSQSQSDMASSQLDLGIALVLYTWPALTLAVQSSWGGPTSSDKRDWFGGAISEMLSDRPETDTEDLEDVLIQVMNDEFDVVIDDESAGVVAARIINLRDQCSRGEFAEIQAMWNEYRQKLERKGNGDGGGEAAMFRRVEARDEDQETDDEEDEDEDEDDVHMDEAPALIRAPRERVEPEVDGDGFTKVVGKKKR